MLKPFKLALIAAALFAGTANAADCVQTENGPLRTASGDCVRTGSWRAGAITTQVFFAFDRFELDEEARKGLDALAERLGEDRIGRVLTVGHADAVGSEAYNERLSERRAEAVRDYLLSKGWPVQVFSVEAKGEQGPNPERRVDVDVLAAQVPSVD